MALFDSDICELYRERTAYFGADRISSFLRTETSLSNRFFLLTKCLLGCEQDIFFLVNEVRPFDSMEYILWH